MCIHYKYTFFLVINANQIAFLVEILKIMRAIHASLPLQNLKDVCLFSMCVWCVCSNSTNYHLNVTQNFMVTLGCLFVCCQGFLLLFLFLFLFDKYSFQLLFNVTYVNYKENIPQTHSYYLKIHISLYKNVLRRQSLIR